MNFLDVLELQQCKLHYERQQNKTLMMKNYHRYHDAL